MVAWEAIRDKRRPLYRPILEVIYRSREGLTAREILRRLIRLEHLPATAERNNVSPRLTELLEAGCVMNPVGSDGRLVLKQVPGDASASVWRVTARGLEFLRVLSGGRE